MRQAPARILAVFALALGTFASFALSEVRAEELIASGGRGAMFLCQPAQGEVTTFPKKVHKKTIYALAVGGGRMVTGDSKGNLALWDLSDKSYKEIDDAHSSDVRWAAFSPDGSVFATASMDRTVKVWDTATATLVKELEGHESYVYGVNFSTDGSRMATTGSDNKLILWDTADWSEVKETSAHYKASYGAVFSPDDGLIATCSKDKMVKLWDAVTLEEVRMLEGHTAGVYSVAFTLDGTRLVSAGADKSLRIWDVATGTLLHTVDLPVSVSFNAIVISPDGRSVYAADDSGIIYHVSLDGQVLGEFRAQGSVKNMVLKG